MSAHPIVNGMTKLNIDHLRPIILIRMPMGMQTAAAPRFRDDPTQEACSSFNVKSYSGSLPFISLGLAGEVQPRAAPERDLSVVRIQDHMSNY